LKTGKSNGHEKRQDGHEKSLSEKLADQLAPFRPDHLPEADFLNSSRRAGCGQVHEIDTGDEEDEGCDRREDIERADAGVGPDFSLDV
jgi:hypothetical protein